MRNKRGGSDFFKKFGDGVNTIKTNVGEGVTKTQAGINLAKTSANEVTNNYNAELNKAVALPGHFGGRRKTRRRKKRGGMYDTEKEKQLEDIANKIPLGLLQKARNITDPKKKATFLGVKVKDLEDIGKMMKRKNDENKATRAHEKMVKRANKPHDIITPAYEIKEPLVPPLPTGGRRTRRRKKRRKTRKKRAGRKSKKNKRRTRRRR
uniref:Uncharacterized protein n=1 Tax=viral metagenome TaxID=1070528 RepID=A0A6C0JEX9_9ZZZZ